jgi:hypothetical protein
VGLEEDINEFVEPILRTFRGNFRTILVGHLSRVYLRASVEVLEWGRTKFTDRPIYYEGPPIRQAIAYAEERCATLITKMEDETRRQIATVISDGIESKRGIDGLARDIKAECQTMGYTDMGTSRATMIARTETADALEQGFMDRANDLGVTGKEWVVTEPCEICEENGAAGAIGIDELFPSGHLRPPAHPNCRCALAPVMLAKESITEGAPEGHEPYNTSHDEQGRFTAGGGGVGSGSSGSKVRAERARKSYRPATKEVQQRADEHEASVAKIIKGKRTKDNEPFDIIKGDSAVEVKSIAEGAKAEKITMHPDSLRRKLASATARGYITHTVVCDDRTGKTLYKEGVGSFRLSSMREVTMAELSRLIK